MKNEGKAKALRLIDEIRARVAQGEVKGLVIGMVDAKGRVTSAVHVHEVNPTTLIPAAGFATHEVFQLLKGEGHMKKRNLQPTDTVH